MGVVALLIIVVAGGLIYRAYSKNNEKVSFGAASLHEDDSQQVGARANNQYSAAQSQSSLGVSSNSSSARNLGQISQSGSLTGSPLGGSTPTQSKNSSSGSQTIDPSTFVAYEKYKNENQALFGDIVAGTGTTLGNNQTATVVYRGWLTNGQLFDESKTGSDGKLQAFQFKVGSGQVIRGWDQGLTGMKVGGARLVIVPPAVGYGASGQGPIPGNSVLVFQVQLVGVE